MTNEKVAIKEISKRIEKIRNQWDCKGNKQLEKFLISTAKETFYGGAAGGGKSEGIIVSALGNRVVGIMNNKNWKVLILRRTFPELEGSLIRRAKELFYGIWKYDGQKHAGVFPSGGYIQFGHIKNDDDAIKYQSMEFNLIEFDELTHFTERMYLYLFSRMRTTDPLIITQIKSASNPGNLGHNWVWERFIKDKEPETKYTTITQMPDGSKLTWSKCFIPASVFDNKILIQNDPNYLRSLYELPEVEKEAFLYGNWDIFQGQYFKELNEDHICDEFEISQDLPIWISLDWGYTTKCAVLFFTEDKNGNVYCFDEIYESHKSVDEIKDMIASKLGNLFKNVRSCYADRRLSTKDGDNDISIHEKFQQGGIKLFFDIVNEERVSGWYSCREMLMKTYTGELKFKIFRRCANFVRTMKQMIHDKNKLEDINKQSESHLPDAFRYFCVRRRGKNIERTYEPEIQLNPVTGYIGIMRNSKRLRDMIQRLPELKRGTNYFLDKNVL